MSHWAENRCDSCGKRIHPNQGALCHGCVFDEVAEARDPDEATFTAWVATGIGADPFNERDDHETPDEVFAKRDDEWRRFPLDWWNRRPGGDVA